MSDTKVCSKCQRELPSEAFAKDSTAKDKMTCACKECRKSQFAKWYAVNAGADRQKGREYREANAEKERERYTRYDQANKERKRVARKVRETSDREKYNARMREWRSKNLERQRLYERIARQKHRAKRVGSYGSLLVVEWQTLCEQYDYRCLCCGEQTDLVPDHVIPLKHGGTSNIDNIQPLCGECNNMKKTRRIDFRRTWAIARGLET